jgi:nicotinamide-nucleotide amidase
MGKKKLTSRPVNGAQSPWVSLVQDCVETLRERGQTVGFAESCTGGLVSSVFTRLPGVSDVFKGAIVAYAYDVKEHMLNVPTPMLRSMGAVSLPVARKMAEGARVALDATWTVAITGVAGPGGGSPAKPVGTVCFAIHGPGVERVLQRHFAGARREIQLRAARFALRLLRHELGVAQRQQQNRKPSGRKS